MLGIRKKRRIAKSNDTEEERDYVEVRDLRTCLKWDLPLTETSDFEESDFYGFCD